jgi:hypothetical protein
MIKYTTLSCHCCAMLKWKYVGYHFRRQFHCAFLKDWCCLMHNVMHTAFTSVYDSIFLKQILYLWIMNFFSSNVNATFMVAIAWLDRPKATVHNYLYVIHKIPERTMLSWSLYTVCTREDNFLALSLWSKTAFPIYANILCALTANLWSYMDKLQKYDLVKILLLYQKLLSFSDIKHLPYFACWVLYNA